MHASGGTKRVKVLHALVVAIVATGGLTACDTSVQFADAKPASKTGAAGRSGIAVTMKAWDAVQGHRLNFAHESVCQNVVDGIRELAETQPGTQGDIIESCAPSTVNGPGIVRFAPEQKSESVSSNRDFPAVGDSCSVSASAIVAIKYCDVDVTPSRDVPKFFGDDQVLVAEARLSHLPLMIAHAIVPLPSADTLNKATAQQVMGRDVRRDLDVNRNAYNALVRRAYSGTEPIFELANAESTLPDGARTFFMVDKDTGFTLAEQYTAAGGRPNDHGKWNDAVVMLIALGSAQT
jgi:hypothetical protein